MSSPNPNPNPSRPSRRCVSSPAARRRSSSCRHHLPCSYHVVTTCLPCAYHVLTMYLPCRSCSSGTTTHYVLTMYLPRAYYALTMHSPRRCVRVAGLRAQQPRDAPLRRARRGDAHPCLQPLGAQPATLGTQPATLCAQPATPCAQVKHTVYSDFDVDNWYVPSQLRPLPASYTPLNRVWCQPATPPYRVRLLTHRLPSPHTPQVRLPSLHPLHYTPSGTSRSRMAVSPRSVSQVSK